jgi:hypothetical protein
MLPGGQASLTGDVLEEHGAILDEAAGGDGPVLLIEHCRVRASCVDSTYCGRLPAFSRFVGLRIGGV